MHRLTTTTTGSMDSQPGLLSGGALKDIVKVENKKFTLKIKKAAPKPTEAGNWKESDAKSMLQHSCIHLHKEKRCLISSRCRRQTLRSRLTSRKPSRREDARWIPNRPPP